MGRVARTRCWNISEGAAILRKNDGNSFGLFGRAYDVFFQLIIINFSDD